MMLHGELIDLRLFRESDLEEFVKLWQDIEGRGLYYPRGLTAGVVRRRDFLENGYWKNDMGRMAIVDKEDVLQGQVLCFEPSPYMNTLEIAYIIWRTDSRGKGYMTEAVHLFTDYLFDMHRIERLQLTVFPGNDASRRVAEKCGFKSEGVMRRAYFHLGRYVDLELFSLLRDERPSLQ
jgi:ribosomal-protein-alanine N-acetyltransferase